MVSKYFKRHKTFRCALTPCGFCDHMAVPTTRETEEWLRDNDHVALLKNCYRYTSLPSKYFPSLATETSWAPTRALPRCLTRTHAAGVRQALPARDWTAVSQQVRVAEVLGPDHRTVSQGPVCGSVQSPAEPRHNRPAGRQPDAQHVVVGLCWVMSANPTPTYHCGLGVVDARHLTAYSIPNHTLFS